MTPLPPPPPATLLRRILRRRRKRCSSSSSSSRRRRRRRRRRTPLCGRVEGWRVYNHQNSPLDVIYKWILGKHRPNSQRIHLRRDWEQAGGGVSLSWGVTPSRHLRTNKLGVTEETSWHVHHRCEPRFNGLQPSEGTDASPLKAVFMIQAPIFSTKDTAESGPSLPTSRCFCFWPRQNKHQTNQAGGHTDSENLFFCRP